MCEQPDKLAFCSLRAATQFSYDQLQKFGRVLRPYADCSCGSYHLTTKPVAGATELNAAMVIALWEQVGS